MKIQHREGSNSYKFKVGERKMVHFRFELNDLSIFGNGDKKSIAIRGNYQKCRKLLVLNELNELNLILKSGEDFEIGSPVLTKKRSKKDIKNACIGSSKDIKSEPARLEVLLVIPPGNGVRVYSVDGSCETYLINQGGTFYETNDPKLAAEATGGVHF